MTQGQRTLRAVGKLVRQLIRKRDDIIYMEDRNVDEIMRDETWYNKAYSDGTFRKPFHEIFLWAVLMNRWVRGHIDTTGTGAKRLI